MLGDRTNGNLERQPGYEVMGFDASDSGGSTGDGRDMEVDGGIVAGE